MSQRCTIGLLALAAACGGRAAAPAVAPAPSPEAAVRNFMQAVADSNVALMGRYWGASRGPAAETGQPPDYQKRLVIMQVYLRGNAHRVVANDPVAGDENRRVLQVELSRPDCVRTVPFTLVRTGGGAWVVNQFNLEEVGHPAKPCAE